MSKFFTLKEKLSNLIFRKSSQNAQQQRCVKSQKSSPIRQVEKKKCLKVMNIVEQKAIDIMNLQEQIDQNCSKNLDDDENRLSKLYSEMQMEIINQQMRCLIQSDKKYEKKKLKRKNISLNMNQLKFQQKGTTIVKKQQCQQFIKSSLEFQSKMNHLVFLLKKQNLAEQNLKNLKKKRLHHSRSLSVTNSHHDIEQEQKPDIDQIMPLTHRNYQISSTSYSKIQPIIAINYQQKEYQNVRLCKLNQIQEVSKIQNEMLNEKSERIFRLVKYYNNQIEHLRIELNNTIEQKEEVFIKMEEMEKQKWQEISAIEEKYQKQQNYFTSIIDQ